MICSSLDLGELLFGAFGIEAVFERSDSLEDGVDVGGAVVPVSNSHGDAIEAWKSRSWGQPRDRQDQVRQE